jgi:hypothetical protein
MPSDRAEKILLVIKLRSNPLRNNKSDAATLLVGVELFGG